MTQLNQFLSIHLPRYVIKERLGAGGMATVFRATDKHLHRDVAIKVMHEHLIYEPTFKERFEREARLIASFNHPNIVSIFDYAVLEAGDDKVYYMVMPFMSGKSLLDILEECRQQEKTLQHDRVRQIMANIASALDYAHERGMVHRDIKPANILFDEHNQAILTDFGIARLAERNDLTQDGTVIGTPDYMSPEQASGLAVDSRSDIYSLGTVLYEMLTGRPPFQDDGGTPVLWKHIKEQPLPVSALMDERNIELDIVLDNALAKIPEERYQSGAALLRDLEAVFADETPEQLEAQNQIKIRSAKPDPLVITEVLSNQSEIPVNRATSTLTRTFETIILQPARQNPLGLVAIGIAIVALLVVVRLSQIAPQTSSPDLETPTVITADSMTGETYYFESDFSLDDPTLAHWEQGDIGSIIRYFDDGEYIISNTAPEQAITTLFAPDYTYEDITITLEGHLLEESANESSAYGIVFRYLDPENYYVFAVDGIGRFSIWIRYQGRWRELRGIGENWTHHDTVHQITETNILELTAVGSHFTGSVNGEQVVEITDNSLDSGGVGIYMASTREGGAKTAIDRYQVSAVRLTDEVDDETKAMTESMTGEEHAVSSESTEEAATENTP